MKKLNVGELSVRLGLNDSEFKKGMGNAEGMMKKTADRMGKIGGSLTKKVTLPIAGLFAGFFKSAMTLEATEAKYNTVFDGMTGTVDDYIKEFQRLTPATTAEARSMYSGIQDILVPMGFVREEAGELTGELGHLIGALTNFNSAEKNAEDVTRAFQSALVGQYEPLNSLGIVTNKSAVQQKALEMGLAGSKEELTKQHEALALTEIAYEASGDALKAYTEENLDVKTKLGLLKAELIDTAGQIGTLFLPMIDSIIEKVRVWSTWLAGLGEEQQKLIVTIMAVVGAIGPLLLVGSKLINSFSVIKGALMAVSGPAWIIIGVIAVLIATFVHLWKNNETFRDKVLEIWGKLKEFIPQAIEKIKEYAEIGMEKVRVAFEIVSDIIENVVIPIVTRIWETAQEVFPAVQGIVERVFEIVKSVLETFMEVVGKVVETIIEWVNENEETLNAIQEGFETMMKKVMEVMDIIVGFLEETWKFIQGLWDKYGDALMSIIKIAFDTISGIIQGAMDVITGILDVFIGIFTLDWQKFNDGATKIWSGMWETIKSILSGAWGILKTVFGGLLGNIKDWFLGLVSDAKGWVGDMVTAFKDKIKGAWGSIKSSFGLLLIKIGSWFRSLPGKAKTWGRNMLNGFAKGIKEKAKSVVRAVKNTVDKALAYIKFWSPAEKGEGRFITHFGRNMIDGFLDGVKQMTPEVEKVMNKVIPNMSPTLKLNAVGQTPGGVVNNRSETVQNIEIHSNKPLSASEVARKLKRTSRELAMGVS